MLTFAVLFYFIFYSFIDSTTFIDLGISIYLDYTIPA